jgi:hypothetical protein
MRLGYPTSHGHQPSLLGGLHTARVSCDAAALTLSKRICASSFHPQYNDFRAEHDMQESVPGSELNELWMSNRESDAR